MSATCRRRQRTKCRARRHRPRRTATPTVRTERNLADPVRIVRHVAVHLRLCRYLRTAVRGCPPPVKCVPVACRRRQRTNHRANLNIPRRATASTVCVERNGVAPVRIVRHVGVYLRLSRYLRTAARGCPPPVKCVPVACRRRQRTNHRANLNIPRRATASTVCVERNGVAPVRIVRHVGVYLRLSRYLRTAARGCPPPVERAPAARRNRQRTDHSTVVNNPRRVTASAVHVECNGADPACVVCHVSTHLRLSRYLRAAARGCPPPVERAPAARRRRQPSYSCAILDRLRQTTVPAVRIESDDE